MDNDKGWIVKKYTNTVLEIGTPLYLMWTEEHQKQNPKCTFKGNVRIANLQWIANGYNFMVFKDNSVRKIHDCDVEKTITASNNIVASRQAGHTRAKATAAEEPVSPVFDPDDDEEDMEDEDVSEAEEEDAAEENINLPHGETRLQTLLGSNHVLTSFDGNGDGVSGKEGHGLNGDGGTASTPGSDELPKLAEDPAKENNQGQAEEPGKEGHGLNGYGGTASTPESDEVPKLAEDPAKENNQGQAEEPGKEGHGHTVDGGTASTPESEELTKVADDHAKENGVEDKESDGVSGKAGLDCNGHGSNMTSSLFQGLGNGPFPTIPSLPDTMRECREMENLLKSKKILLRKLQREKADPDNKKKAKKELEDQLKALKNEVKKEKETLKQEEKAKVPAKRRREDNNEDDNNWGSDDYEFFKTPGKRVLTTIDKWQKGHRRAALCAARNKLVEKATSDSWEEGYHNMCEYGFAVVNHWAYLVHPLCRPTAEQRDYMQTCT